MPRAGVGTGCWLLFRRRKRPRRILAHNCRYSSLSDEYLMPRQAQSSPTFTPANITATLPPNSSLARGANHTHDTSECANSLLICACDRDWVYESCGIGLSVAVSSDWTGHRDCAACKVAVTLFFLVSSKLATLAFQPRVRYGRYPKT